MNELTAVLSSGVSLFRVARPIVAFGIVTTALAVLDTEVIIPSVAHLLARRHDDAGGYRTCEVLFLKGWDSAPGRACFTPHTGFKNPGRAEDFIPRESIEVRTLVVY